MKIDLFVGLHKCTKNKMGKIAKMELFTLIKHDRDSRNFEKLKEKIKSFPEATSLDIQQTPNPQAFLPLKIVAKLKSNSKYTEAFSRFVWFNNSIWLVRIYKFADPSKNWLKLEISRVNYGKRKYGNTTTSRVRGGVKLIRSIIKNLEQDLLPLNYHDDEWENITPFL